MRRLSWRMARPATGCRSPGSPTMKLTLCPPTAIAAALLLAIACVGSVTNVDAQAEANRKVVLDFYEKGLNQKDADAAIALIGNRYVQHFYYSAYRTKCF